MPPRRSEWASDGGLLLLALIWGVNFSVVKHVLEELEPLALNALRFPLAAVALWLVLRVTGGPLLPTRSDVPRVLWLGLLGHVVYQLCFIFGIDWTLAGNASLLLATTPVWTVMLSAIAGHERPDPRVVGGITATLGGIALVVLGRGETLSIGSATLRGDLLMIVASMLWAIYTVGGRGPVRRYGPVQITAWTVWAGTPFQMALGAPGVVRADLSEISWGAYAGVVYAGLLAIGLAYLLWYRGVERLGNNRTALYSNLVPVAALVTAWLWLGEIPAPLQLVGAAIILGGLRVARVAPPALEA